MNRPSTELIYEHRGYLDTGFDRIYTRYFRPATLPEPPVIVLVHGFAASGRYMIPTARALARHYRVYVPDLPGWGLTPCPYPALDTPTLADVTAGWMNALGVEDAVLIGNSYGCEIVVDFALRHPHRLQYAVLLAPTMDPYMRTAFQQITHLALDALREPFSLLVMLAVDYLRFGVVRGVHTMRHMLANRLEDKLPQVQAPTLVVRGDRDPLITERWAEEAAALLPCGHQVVLEGVAHAINYTAPEAVGRLTRAWIRGVPTQGATNGFRSEQQRIHTLPGK